jgi:hypothetical protein
MFSGASSITSSHDDSIVYADDVAPGRLRHKKTQRELGFFMAEREGFEPSIGLTLYALSRGAPSATRPSLRKGCE